MCVPFYTVIADLVNHAKTVYSKEWLLMASETK